MQFYILQIKGLFGKWKTMEIQMNREFKLLFDEFHALLNAVDQYAQNPKSKAAQGLLKSIPLRYSFEKDQIVTLRRNFFDQDKLIGREGDKVTITRIVDTDRPYSV